MRVLITGMGGELGTRVAQLLEATPEATAICGMDVDPPRRRLRRVEFHRVDPSDRSRTAAVVRTFEPTHVAHLGIFEPNARSGPARAVARTASGTVGLLSTLAAVGTVRRIVARSGIEVYGRRRGGAVCPDEEVVPDPTTAFGHSLRHVEQVAHGVGRRLDVPVTSLRFAPLLGPHFPSPLGRVLRLPVVPVAALGDPPFVVLHPADAAEAVVAALGVVHDGPLDVVAPGAVTPVAAVRQGGRLPLPVLGPGWRPARLLAELAGAPLPDHVRELLVRGRAAAGHRAAEVLGRPPSRSTPEVVGDLFEWPTVTHLQPSEEVA